MDAANIRQRTSDAVTDYRYRRFTTRLLLRDLRFGKKGPGHALPSFELLTTSGDRLVNGNVFGDKPVLVIFGSMTCPMTASAAPSVQELYDEVGDRVDRKPGR